MKVCRWQVDNIALTESHKSQRQNPNYLAAWVHGEFQILHESRALKHQILFFLYKDPFHVLEAISFLKELLNFFLPSLLVYFTFTTRGNSKTACLEQSNESYMSQTSASASNIVYGAIWLKTIFCFYSLFILKRHFFFGIETK